MGGIQEPRPLLSAYDSPTFEEGGHFRVDKPVGSMSISPCGRDVVLASRQGLHIIDLDNPWSPPRHLPHHTPWEVADVQWSPFASRDYWVVSTSNQKALVWNLAAVNPQASIEHVLHAHSRAITDINFSAHHPDILATCAVDSFVHCWDLRYAAKPAMTFCDWFAGATQVKWNRQDSHIVASSHDKFLRIWDDRKGAYPLRSIEAHKTKIYGVDWDRRQSNRVVTCSLDKTIKFWDSSKAVDEPERVIQTPFPVWRARHTPFGRGLLAMPQRGNNDLHLYDQRLGEDVQQADTTRPVHQFEGHQDQVKEFLWRARGPISDNVDHREFQLVSWGSDRFLRLHKMGENILEKIGYIKGKEVRSKMNMSRRNAKYRTFRESPARLGFDSRNGIATNDSHLDSESGIGMRSALSLGISKAHLPLSGEWSAGGFMSSRAGPQGRIAARKDMNPIAWMKGVKIGNREASTSELQQRAISTISPGAKPDLHWDTFESLGEEIIHVGDKFGKVSFDEVDMPNRLVVVSMYGPWASDETPVYVKCRINFPLEYPDISTPKVTLEKISSISSRTISRISLELQTILDAYTAHRRASLEIILRYLQGEQNLKEATAWLKEELLDNSLDLKDDGAASSSDEEDDGEGLFAGSNDAEMSNSGLLGSSGANANVPLPKACGALWADNGQLVCFFPPKEEKTTSLLEHLSLQGKDEMTKSHQKIFEVFGRPQTGSAVAKSRESTLRTSASENSDSESDSDDSYVSSSSSSASSTDLGLTRRHFNPPAAWRDGTLDIQRARSADHSQKSTTSTSALKAGLKQPKNIVSIHNFETLLPAKRQLARRYVISGPNACKHNATVATSEGFPALADAWSFIDLILRDEVPLDLVTPATGHEAIMVVAKSALGSLRRKDSALDLSFDTEKASKQSSRGSIKWGAHPFGGQYFVKSLFRHFEALGDIQMLAMMSCVLDKNSFGVDDATLRRSHQSMTSRELDNSWNTKLVASLSLQQQASVAPSDYYPNDQVAWSLLRPPTKKVPLPKGAEQQGLEPFSATLSSEFSSSDPITPFSTGATPPKSFRGGRTSLDLLDTNSQTISTSPEDLRRPHRSKSNLASAFAASISRPFSFSVSASSSPPNVHPKKQPSPIGSYVPDAFSNIPATSSVVWGTTSIFGRTSTGVEEPKSSRSVVHRSSGTETATPRTPKVKVSLKNQNHFHNEAYASLPLLDPYEQWKYRAYRDAYAYMLFIWDAPITMVEVLKYNGNAIVPTKLALQTSNGIHPPNIVIPIGKKALDDNLSEVPRHGLHIRRTCASCSKVQKPSANPEASTNCSQCPSKLAPLVCVFCTEIIRGLASPCLACGHVVHSSCRAHLLSLSDGPEDSEYCVTGCGCRCLEHMITPVEVPPEQQPVVDTELDSRLAREERADEREQHESEEGDEDAWEDVAYESLAKNLGVRGERYLRPRGSQIWRGAGSGNRGSLG